MSRSSSVEPPARFPYTDRIVFPPCPLTVLQGIEERTGEIPGAARRPLRLIKGVFSGGCDAQSHGVLTAVTRWHGRSAAPPRRGWRRVCRTDPWAPPGDDGG